MIVPYIDALIGLAQHQAFVWNKTQSTKLELIVEQKRTSMKKKLLDEAIEQEKIDKDLEQKRYDSDRSKTRGILNNFDGILKEDSLTLLKQHEEDPSKVSDESLRRIRNYINLGKTVEWSYPFNQIAELHFRFVDALSEFLDVIEKRQSVKSLAQIEPHNQQTKDEFKSKINKAILCYRDYRKAISEKYHY